MRRQAPSTSPKITWPRLHGVVPRRRLFDRLAGMSAPLRWIGAGPGYGKTTLAVGWIEACYGRGLRYSVDAGDDDPAAFFGDLGAAASAAGLPHASSLPRWPGDGAAVATHARRFFRHLFGAWPSDLAFVIDNVHSVAPAAFGELLRVAVEELPDDVPMLALSRELPPSALARHVAQAKIEVLDAAELRFTPAECAELLRERRVVASAGSTLLLERCEGWAAGLVLMTDSLRHGGASTPVGDDAAHHVVFDFFAGEVLARCTPGEQGDLMRMALLPHVSPALASAMGVRGDVLGLLERLHRQHLFVERVPSREPVYRLHGLLQAFLKERATASWPPSELAACAAAAARLLVAEGAADDAVQLLIDTQCWPEAAECVARLAPEIVEGGRRRTFACWTRALPSEWLDRLPWLGYWAGVCRVFDDPAEGATLLSAAHRRFAESGDRDGRVLAAGAITRALLLQPDWASLDVWIDELDAQWGAGTGTLSAQARLMGGARLLYATLARMPGRPGQSSWAACVQTQLAGLEPSDEGLLAGFALLMHHNWTGNTALARQLVRQLEPWAASAARGVVARAYWSWARAMHRWWCGEPGHALAAIDEALALAAEHGLAIGAVIQRYRVMALLGAARLAEAEGELQRLATSPRVEPYFELCAWAALQRGDLAAAREDAQAARALAESRGRTFYVLQDHLLLAIIEARAGKVVQARLHLERYRDGTRDVPGDLPRYQAAWVDAELAMQGGDRSACLAALAVAGTLGEQNHYRSFVGWDPAFVQPLLGVAVASDVATDHARALIHAHHLRAPAVDTPNWPWPIRIRTFGHFEVMVAGQQEPWSARVPRKPLELMQTLLALQARVGQDVPATAVIDQLWPEADGDAAHNAFNVALSRLRKLLGDAQAVLQHDGRLRLDVQRVWTDLAALQQLAECAEAANEPDDAERLAQRLLDVYRGPFLVDNAAPWAAACRDRQRQRFRLAMTGLIDRLERSGRHEAAGRIRLRCDEVDLQAAPQRAVGRGRPLWLVRN